MWHVVIMSAVGTIIGVMFVQLMGMFASGALSGDRNNAWLLAERGRTLRDAIVTFYKEENVLPRYVADLECSREDCPGQQDAVFFTSFQGEWLSIKPYIEDNRLYFACRTTNRAVRSEGYHFNQCEPLDRETLPTFATPTFQCRDARTAVEKLICASDRLAELDNRLLATYSGRMARASAEAKEDLKSSQLAFIREREVRCHDEICVESITRQRIVDLEMYEYRDELFPPDSQCETAEPELDLFHGPKTEESEGTTLPVG